jgi:hypothetical protein
MGKLGGERGYVYRVLYHMRKKEYSVFTVSTHGNIKNTRIVKYFPDTDEIEYMEDPHEEISPELQLAIRTSYKDGERGRDNE